MAGGDIGDLVVGLEADLKGFRQEMQEGQKLVAASASRMADSMERFSKESSKSAFSFSRVMETALGVGVVDVLKSAGNSVLEFGKSMFNALVVDGVKAATEAEAAMNRLNQALVASGQYSDKTSLALAKFAGDLQEVTAFEDDAVIGAMGLIESLGQLDQEGLQKATKAAMNLSTALGVDLHSAAMLVGKAASGEVGTLGRYGIKVEEGATKAETFARALDAINSKFGGAAEAALVTYAGATAQLGNNWGNLTEEIGNAIVQNKAVLEVVKAASKIIAEWTGSIGDGQGEIKRLVAEGLIVATKAVVLLVAAFDELYKAGMMVFEAFAAPVRAFTASIMAAGRAIQGDFAGAMDVLKFVTKENTKAWDEAKEGSKTAETLGVAVARLQHAAEDGLSAMSKQSDTVTRVLAAQATSAQAAKKAVQELSEEQKKLGEEGQKLAKSLLEKADPHQKYADEFNALTEARSEMLITEQAYDAAITASRLNRDNTVYESNAKLVADYMAQNEAMRILDEDDNAAAIAANQAKIDQIMTQERLSMTDLARLRAERKKKEDDLDRQRLSAAADTFGGIAAIAKIAGDDMFQIWKAASMAQTIIQGVQAVQVALASAPPPFNFALAAVQGALAAANVAKIASTNLATGIDSVPGVGTRDNFPAMLAPGERVVPAETNRDLKGFLSGDHAMVDMLKVIAGKLDRLGGTIQIAIGGRVITEVLNDELRAGRRLAIP